MPRLFSWAIVALIALPALAQNKSAPTPPRAKIHCFECGKNMAGDPPFTPRRTVLGQHMDVIGPQLARQAGVRPIVIETPRITIVAAVEGSPSDDLSLNEVEYLQALFPAVKPGAALDAHQEAHLLAHRARAIEKELTDILELDTDGRVKPESSPNRPVSSPQVEVLVFSKPAGFETFTAFQFDRGVNPLVGAMLESGPTGAVLMPSLKEPSVRCQFAFCTSLQLLAGLSRSGSGLQGWIRDGLARLMEDRHGPKSERSITIAPLAPGVNPAKDWEAFLGDMIADNKVGDLGGMSVTPLSGLSLRSEVQSWSMVRWMVTKDQAKFAAMVRLLLHAPPTDSPQKALLEAVRAAWGHDLVSLVDEWKEAVKKARSAK